MEHTISNDLFMVVLTREVTICDLTARYYNIVAIDGVDKRPCMLYDSDFTFTSRHCAEMNAWCRIHQLVPDYQNGVEKARADIRQQTIEHIQNLRSQGYSSEYIENVLAAYEETI